MTEPTQPELDDPIVAFMLSLGFFMRFTPAETYRIKKQVRHKDAEYLFFPIEPDKTGAVVMNCLVLHGTRQGHSQRFLPAFWSDKLLREMPALFAKDPLLPYPRNRTLNMLHVLAKTITDLGYPLTHTPETLVIWDACQVLLPQIATDDREAQHYVIEYAAAIAALPQISLDDKIDYAIRDVPLDVIRGFIANHTPTGMVAALYPAADNGDLRQFLQPKVVA